MGAIQKLNIKEEVKFYTWSEGHELQRIAEELRMSKQQLNNKLTNETLRYSELKKIARFLGYNIKWEKRL